MLDIIFNYIANPYLSIESALQLVALMEVNHDFNNRVNKLLEIEDISSALNEDKVFINELLENSNLIASQSSDEQMHWCNEKIHIIARKSNYTDEAIHFLMKIICKNLQHIKFDIIENTSNLRYLEPDEQYKIFNIIFNILLEKTNIESLYLIVI